MDQLSNPVRNNKNEISKSSFELNNNDSNNKSKEKIENFRFENGQNLLRTSNKDTSNSKSTSYLDSIFKKNSSSNINNNCKNRVKFSLYHQG
jgi:hypothetical protein